MSEQISGLMVPWNIQRKPTSFPSLRFPHPDIVVLFLVIPCGFWDVSFLTRD